MREAALHLFFWRIRTSFAPRQEVEIQTEKLKVQPFKK